MSVPLPRCPPAPPCKGTADLLTPLPVRHHPIGQLEKVFSPLSPTPCSWFGASPGGQEASQPPETGPWAVPLPNPGQHFTPAKGTWSLCARSVADALVTCDCEEPPG